jgi:phosphatidylserine/phosphatidylglycerophosphate/cardiolipin synthase-like enzyme
MDQALVTKMLRETLEDHRMSRGERQALDASLREMHASRRDLDVIRATVFDIAAAEIDDRGAREVLAWTEEAVKVLSGLRRGDPETSTAEVAFTPGEDCRMRVTGVLAGARRTADLCVFTITDDRIARAIRTAHERGVAVRIITDDEKAGDLGSDIPRLAEAGIPVAMDDSPSHMHHKFAVIDGRVLLTGSFNWTRSASEANQENVVVTDDPRLVRPFATEFERLWNQMSR